MLCLPHCLVVALTRRQSLSFRWLRVLHDEELYLVAKKGIGMKKIGRVLQNRGAAVPVGRRSIERTILYQGETISVQSFIRFAECQGGPMIEARVRDDRL